MASAPSGDPGIGNHDAAPVVGPGAHLTLHYRLQLPERQVDVMSTFGGSPATLQLGQGQLAEPLERCLLGLVEGARARFDLEPGLAFGPRNPELLQRVSRALLDRQGPRAADEALVPGDLVEFPGPNGERVAGVLKEINDAWALFDFNHPLAGQPVCFEVEIIGVLPS